MNREFLAYSSTCIEQGSVDLESQSFTIRERRKIGSPAIIQPELHETGWNEYIQEVLKRIHGAIFFPGQRVVCGRGINRDGSAHIRRGVLTRATSYSAWVVLDGDETETRVELGSFYHEG